MRKFLISGLFLGAAVPALLVAQPAIKPPTPVTIVPAAPATKATVNAWGISSADVPADPAVRYGRLANGMKYAIMKNATPKGAASLRMRFAFGSIGEAEHERGLAHFIEHMAFNGTTNVPEGDMKKILERQGLAFGPDTNASTGFDATTYMIDVPKADAERLDTAFFLLRETASELKFDPAAVDRERGVVISERRSRDNFQLRQAVENLKFHGPLTPYPTRLPIGTDEVLSKAGAGTLADLYRRYYRPENATLIVVGDIDPAAIEAQVKAKFGDWAGKGPAGAPLPRGRIAIDRPQDIATFIDPAVPTAATLTVMRPWEDPADTLAERRRSLIRNVASSLLTRRLQQLSNAPGSSILFGSMNTGANKDASLSSALTVVTRDGEWKGAVQTAEQELRRALQHGFRASELRFQLIDIEGALKLAADQADTRTNASLAQSLVGVIDENDVVTTPQFRLNFFKAAKPTITIDEVNAEFRKLWQGSAPLVFISDKTPIADKAAIAAVLDASRKLAVAPPKDQGAIKFAYSEFGPAGRIVEDKRIPDLGIRTIRFANNVRLNLKQTDYEKGGVRFQVRLAGGALALPQDKPGMATLMSALSSLAALEKHSFEDLKLILAGHTVTAGFTVEEDAFVSRGSTSAHDLALQMKLSAAFFTAPGYRQEADSRWQSIVPVIDSQTRSGAQQLASAKAPMIIANDDARFGLPEAPQLAARNLAEARAALAPVLSSAPIEIGIVGDVDEARAIDAVARSFGALPARAAEIPSYAAQRQARFRADLAPVTLTHKGQEDQALVLAGWPTTDDDDYQRTVGLIMLADLLDLELTEKLREELGASYGVNVSSLNSSVFDQFGYVTASVVVDPKRIDEVEKAIGEVVARLRDQPVSADLLARARNPNLERIDRQERDNAYWLVRVGEAQSDAERLDRHRLRKAAYLAVTPEQVRALARQYLAADRRLTLRVVSDKAQLAAR